MLAGTLLFRYCVVRFDGRIPTLRLPAPGHAADFDTSGGGKVDVVEVVPNGEGVSCVSGPCLGRK